MPIPSTAQSCTAPSSDLRNTHGINEQGMLAIEKVAELERAVVEFFGEHRGSIPSERVQNIIKATRPELYEAVVTRQFKKKWNRFLEHLPQTFILFTKPNTPARDEDFCWRIRLTKGPAGWEEVDAEEDTQRLQREEEVRRAATAILKTCPEQASCMRELTNTIQMGTDPTGNPSRAHTTQKRLKLAELKRILRRADSDFAMYDVSNMTLIRLLTPPPAT